tara:strand:- start:22254 stop:23288 length:1035 start_codon:yes stop_codon:yes gene_type:complete
LELIIWSNGIYPIINQNKLKRDVVYIFPKYDFKLKNWSKYSNKNIIFPRKNNYLYFFILIIKMIVKNYKVIVFYRYLNVSSNFVKEYLKLLIDLLIFFLKFINLIDIRWINHNIDKESVNKINLIVNIKRRLLSKLSTVIYITSEIFLNKVNFEKNKIKVISFGKIENDTLYQNNLILKKKFIDFKNKLNKKFDKKVYLGLSVNFESKHQNTNLSLKKIAGNYDSFVICFINFSKTKISNQFFLNFSERISFNEKYINDVIDFIYKESNDISIPYSIYSAASGKIPFFTNKESFFSNELLNYEIGFIVENSSDLIKKIKSYNKSKAINYLKIKNWEKAANKLFN